MQRLQDSFEISWRRTEGWRSPVAVPVYWRQQRCQARRENGRHQQKWATSARRGHAETTSKEGHGEEGQKRSAQNAQERASGEPSTTMPQPKNIRVATLQPSQSPNQQAPARPFSTPPSPHTHTRRQQ